MTKFELRVLNMEANAAAHKAVHLADKFHTALREYLGEPTEAEMNDLEPEFRTELVGRMAGLLVEAMALRVEAAEEPEPDYEPNGSLPSFEDFLKSMAQASSVTETDFHLDFVKPGETATQGIVMMIKRDRKTKNITQPITLKVEGRFIDVEFSELTDKSKVDIHKFCDKNDK